MGRRVFVFSPDNPRPSGGVKKLYDHVDILNAEGIESCIVHENDGFKPLWFNSSTPVTSPAACKITKDDFLLIPEIYGRDILNIYPGTKKVIFNQNAFNTLRFFGSNPSLAHEVYMHPDVVGVLVVSEHDRMYMTGLFPEVNIHRIHYGIDNTLFAFNTGKKNCIAYSPRKLSEEAEHLIQLLEMRGRINGFEIKKLENLSRNEFAGALKESLIFISLSNNEGFGLPPAEAMACGCIVIGFHGNAGKEFFKPDHSFPIESRDILAFAQTVELVVSGCDVEPEKYLRMGKRASEFIFDTYSMERERRDVIGFWEGLGLKFKV